MVSVRRSVWHALKLIFFLADVCLSTMMAVDNRAISHAVLQHDLDNCGENYYICCQSGSASRLMCRSGWANLVLFPKIATGRLQALIGRA